MASKRVSIVHLLDLRELRERFTQKQESLGIHSYVGMQMIERPGFAEIRDGTIAISSGCPPPSAAELVIVATKNAPPTTNLLAALARAIGNLSNDVRLVGYGIASCDWHDYELGESLIRCFSWTIRSFFRWNGSSPSRASQPNRVFSSSGSSRSPQAVI